jgi:hypothetical protein
MSAAPAPPAACSLPLPSCPRAAARPGASHVPTASLYPPRRRPDGGGPASCAPRASTPQGEVRAGAAWRVRERARPLLHS